MKKYKVTNTYKYEISFEVDENSEKFKHLVNKFRKEIKNDAKLPYILNHILYKYLIRRQDFVEGLGSGDQIYMAGIIINSAKEDLIKEEYNEI